MARVCLERLRTILRCLLDAWSEASTIGATNGDFGCTAGRPRWGVRSVAPQARWRLPTDSWMLGDGFWLVGRVYGGLEREIADVVFSGSEGRLSVCGARFGL